MQKQRARQRRQGRRRCGGTVHTVRHAVNVEHGGVAAGGDGERRVMTVQHAAVTKEQYLDATGTAGRRFRGADAYTGMQKAAAAAKERGNLKKASKIMKEARRMGFQPAEVTSVIDELKELSLANVVAAQTDGEVLEGAKERIRRLLNPDGYWRFVSSRTHRQLRFQREKAKMRGLQMLVDKVAPRTRDRETALVLGAWGGVERRGETPVPPQFALCAAMPLQCAV
jgi:hypothetical protein